MRSGSALDGRRDRRSPTPARPSRGASSPLRAETDVPARRQRPARNRSFHEGRRPRGGVDPGGGRPRRRGCRELRAGARPNCGRSSRLRRRFGRRPSRGSRRRLGFRPSCDPRRACRPTIPGLRRLGVTAANPHSGRPRTLGGRSRQARHVPPAWVRPWREGPTTDWSRSSGAPMTSNWQFKVAANRELDIRDTLRARRGRAEGATGREATLFDAR